MKSKIKRHSRSVLSVILAISMLISCMTVGLIATDAAKVTDNGAVKASISDSESDNASVDTSVSGGEDGVANDTSNSPQDASVGSPASRSKSDDYDEVGAKYDKDSEVGYSSFKIVGTYNGSTNWSGTSLNYVGKDTYGNDKYKLTVIFQQGNTFHFLTDSDQAMSLGTTNVTHSTSQGMTYQNNSNMTWNEAGGIVDVCVNASGHLWFENYVEGITSLVTIKGSFIPTEWSTLDNMTYSSSDSAYYYSVSGDNTVKHFRIRYNSVDYMPWGDANYNLLRTDDGGPFDGSTAAKKYGANTSTNTTLTFYFTAAAGYNYKIWFSTDDGKVWVTTASATPDYYLTGYLNGSDVTTRNNTYKFTQTETSGIYTLAFTSTVATQYPTVFDTNGTAYHPASHKSESGAAATTTDSSPGQDNKWMVSNASGKIINFTWDTTGANPTLSWDSDPVVTIYAKDGCAPINWDDKNNAGASSLEGYNSKYLYNYARIADTTVTSSNGESFTSVDCDIAGGTSGSTYEWGSVKIGSSLIITTTIADQAVGTTNWRSKYYVRGWCINGKTYSGNNSNRVNTTVDSSTGVYTMTYNIPDDTIENSIIEITPIYYLANNSNTITFYLEGYDSVKANWGDTPFVYPFYGSLDGYQNSFGVYPGQPFVYVDGKYSTEIPITSSAIYSTTNDGTTIKGITVSNGYADHVHRNLHYTTWQKLGDGGTGDDQYHMQTYDYDDFYKIYNEKRDSNGNRASSIILRIKNETTTNNRDTYGKDSSGGHNWSYTKGTPDDSLADETVQSIASSGNGWELLTDRYGRPVDLFGNVIGNEYSATAEASKTAIRVISSGYNENIAGDYGTSWLVYTPNSNTCTATDGVYTCSTYTLQKDTSKDRYAIPPSIFLLSSASSFNTTVYKNASHTVDGYAYTDSVNNYKTMYTNLKTSGDSGVNALGRYVYVSYEQNAQRKGNNYGSNTATADYGAKRLDARWYYTYATDMINSKIKVQCWNATSNKFVDAAFVTDNSGYNNKNNVTAAQTIDGKSAAGLKAYFTNTSFDGDVDSGNVLIDSGKFNFTAQSATGWVFKGWYIEYDNGDNYSFISDSASASTSMSSSDTYVARFEPISVGNLNISHIIDTNVTYQGTGTAALQVKVYTDSTKTSELYDSGVVTDDVTLDGTYISNAHSDYYIDVTLLTTPSGDDTFANFSYDSFNTDKNITATENTSTTPKTSNFGFTVSQLFNESTQQYITLSYVSYLNSVGHAYVITYKFAPRGIADTDSSNLKTYTVKGTFTSKEYEAYVDSSVAVAGRTVDNAFIKSKAPFESNFMKTLNLNYDEATQTCTEGSPITHNIVISYTSTATTSKYAIFDLPYEYYTSVPEEADYKLYTAKPDSETNKILKNDNTATFEISTNYLQYFTSTGNQDHVSKDNETINHTKNDFVTAPKVIWDSANNKYLYFNYWLVCKTDRTTQITKVFYEDFHYLAYDNYYVTPVYNDKDATEGDEIFVDPFSDTLGASITYLGDSRNQWNTNDGTEHSEANYAGDLIYNDFAFSFSYHSQELKRSADVSEIGIVIEQISGSDSVASPSVSDMSYYKTYFSSSEADAKNKVGKVVNNETVSGFSTIKKTYDKTQLNNKNRMEKYIALYSQYGQKTDLTFETNAVVDDYVYRAYSYIKLTNGSIAISDPAYFCMKYRANLGYTGD